MRRPNRRPNYTKTEDIENYEIPVSYLIYRDGADIIAVNGNTGKEDSRNTDFSTVVQYACDAIGDDGGIIFIKAGTYYLSTQITSYPGICIKGEGIVATTISQTSGANVVNMLYVNAKKAGGVGFFAEFRDMKIDGNRTNNATGTNGINAHSSASDTYIDNVFVMQCSASGIVSRSYGIRINNALSEFHDDYALMLHNEFTITNSKITSGAKGIYINAQGEINNCKIGGGPTYALYLNSGGAAYEIVISACEIEGDGNIELADGNIWIVNCFIESAVGEIVNHMLEGVCDMSGTAHSRTITGLGNRRLIRRGGLGHDVCVPGTSPDNGTATAGAPTTLTDGGKAWGINAYAGYLLELTGGTGAGQQGESPAIRVL